MLLTQFDEEVNAVINPWTIHHKIDDFPETVVGIFSHHLVGALLEFLGGQEFASVKCANGPNPIYIVEYKGKRIGLHMALVGAPNCVGDFEDVIALGAKRIILLGTCGVLDKNIENCGIIIPTRAIRDEGTSYHYAPPSDYIEVNRKYREEFKEVLNTFGYPYVEGTTWTTDAFYRETRAKVENRKQMGAICVEMECAAMEAMCRLRGVEFFQYFYAADNLDHTNWEPRSLSGTSRLDEKQKIALLAFELAAGNAR